MAGAEGAAEAEKGIEAALLGDFGDAHGGHAEKSAGAFETKLAHVPAEADSARGAETRAQVARAHAELGGELPDRRGDGTALLQGVVDLELEGGARRGDGGGAVGRRGEFGEEQREAQLRQAEFGEVALGAKQVVQLDDEIGVEGEDNVAQRLHRDALGVFEGDEEPVEFFVGGFVMVILIGKDHEAAARGERQLDVVGADDGFALERDDQHMAVVHRAAALRVIQFGAGAPLETDDVFRQGRSLATHAVERAGRTVEPAGPGGQTGEGAETGI